MGWIETPKKGVLGLCAGCANGRECEVAELTPCIVLRDEYIRGWKEACEAILANLEENPLLIHAPMIHNVKDRYDEG